MEKLIRMIQEKQTLRHSTSWNGLVFVDTAYTNANLKDKAVSTFSSSTCSYKELSK